MERGDIVSKLIKFEHGENGTLKVNNGSTSLSDLLTLGAVIHTAKQNKKPFNTEYPTDLAGLQVMSDKAGYAAEFLNESTRAVSVLLAYVDPSEIQGELQSIAWLIAGLSEMAGVVSAAGSEIDCALLSEQAQKKARLT